MAKIQKPSQVTTAKTQARAKTAVVPRAIGQPAPVDTRTTTPVTAPVRKPVMPKVYDANGNPLMAPTGINASSTNINASSSRPVNSPLINLPSQGLGNFFNKLVNSYKMSQAQEIVPEWAKQYTQQPITMPVLRSTPPSRPAGYLQQRPPARSPAPVYGLPPSRPAPTPPVSQPQQPMVPPAMMPPAMTPPATTPPAIGIDKRMPVINDQPIQPPALPAPTLPGGGIGGMPIGPLPLPTPEFQYSSPFSLPFNTPNLEQPQQMRINPQTGEEITEEQYQQMFGQMTPPGMPSNQLMPQMNTATQAISTQPRIF